MPSNVQLADYHHDPAEAYHCELTRCCILRRMGACCFAQRVTAGSLGGIDTQAALLAIAA